jgi:thiol-disulfide isomerase/thioredoxin
MRAVLALLLMLAALPSAAEERSFVLVDPPKALPDVRFMDGDGRNRALSDFRGKVVLLNVWATWCVPCRKEMPTFDRLQGALGGADFQVIALSIDRKGLDVVRKFYGEIGIKNLVMHIDSSGKAARELGAVGLPTTLLIDRAGREIGRLVGPAEWDTPEMIAFIRRRIDQKHDGP